MVDLRQLRQFIAVAEELHFHRAAARLNMSQPPLTATVRQLEKEIGAELLERSNRVIQLTPAGKALLAHARLTVEQANLAVAAARDAAGGYVGTLRLTYVGSALYGRLAKSVRAFRRSFSDVKLDLREATTAAQGWHCVKAQATLLYLSRRSRMMRDCTRAHSMRIVWRSPC